MAIGKIEKAPRSDALLRQAAQRTEQDPGKAKRINFEVDAATHAALKSRAAAEGQTISDVLRKAVDEYLSR